MARVKVTLTVESSSSSGLSCCLVVYSTMYHSSFAHLNCFQKVFLGGGSPRRLQALPLLCISEKVALHALAPLLATDAVTPHSTLASPVVAHGRGKGCWWDPALVVGRHRVLCPRRGAFLVILRCSQLWETFHRFSPGWVSAASSEAEIFFFSVLFLQLQWVL